jgi:hypothetical protein
MRIALPIALLLLCGYDDTSLTRGAEARDHIHQELSELEMLAFKGHQTNAVLEKLRVMWHERDVLRRPLVAYLMCQLGDRSRIPEVAECFFAGEYYTGRPIEPDGAAAGGNAEVVSLRMLILYGAPNHHERLLQCLALAEDPLGKGGRLCGALLGLSSTNEGPGLPVAYPRQRFPLSLVVHCLDYTQQVTTIVYASDGTWHPQRGCDYAAQTVQNITGQDFGHSKRSPVQERDKAIDAIRRWWAGSRPPTRGK